MGLLRATAFSDDEGFSIQCGLLAIGAMMRGIKTKRLRAG
jgi:hypothetical protein